MESVRGKYRTGGGTVFAGERGAGRRIVIEIYPHYTSSIPPPAVYIYDIQ